MEKKALLEKLANYRLMKEHIEEGKLPIDFDMKINELEDQIAELRKQQDDLRMQAKSEADKDLEKINHYIALLEELIAEDDTPVEDAPIEEPVEEAAPIEEAPIEELAEEAPVEEPAPAEPVSRFPQFNVR